MTWWMWGILGAMVTTARNSLLKVVPMSWHPREWMFWVSLALTLGMLYAWGEMFYKSPSFFQAWFFGSAALATLGFVVSMFYFNDTPTALHWFGTVLTLVGAYFLMR